MATFFRAAAANGRGIKLQLFENEIFFDDGVIDAEKRLKYASNFPYQEGDILAVAYPKCGNHWMTNMIWKLKSLSDDKRPKFTVLELIEDECYKMQNAPRIINTHLRASRLPKDHINHDGKIVLMLRNPKDACVSRYHHFRDSTMYFNGQTFDEFYESYFSGDIMYTSYIDTLKEWEDVLYEKLSGKPSLNIEVFYYEDCKVNPMDNIVRLNKFLEFNRDQAYLQKVLEQTDFETMRNHELQDKSRVNQLCFGADGNSLIYRRGKINDWKNYFTVSQSERVDTLIKEKLTRGIIEFPCLT